MCTYRTCRFKIRVERIYRRISLLGGGKVPSLQCSIQSHIEIQFSALCSRHEYRVQTKRRTLYSSYSLSVIHEHMHLVQEQVLR